MSNSGTIKTLTNNGAMRGASSFNVTTTGVLGGAGGAGLANSGTIATLTNKGTISGGNGLVGSGGGTGGAGIANSGTITKLANSGQISGLAGFRGGAGVSNASGATIASLTNATGGTISGGAGSTRGAGGAGIHNSGAILMLTNNGKISGGSGFASPRGRVERKRSGDRLPRERDRRDNQRRRWLLERGGRRGDRQLRRDRHADQQRQQSAAEMAALVSILAAQAAPEYGTRAPSGRWSTAERSKAAWAERALQTARRATPSIAPARMPRSGR